jgi:hypothetical protein
MRCRRSTSFCSFRARALRLARTHRSVAKTTVPSGKRESVRFKSATRSRWFPDHFQSVVDDGRYFSTIARRKVQRAEWSLCRDLRL